MAITARIEAMLITRPQPRAAMRGPNARGHSHGPLRFVSMTASQSASDRSWIGPQILIPALLIRMSARPSELSMSAASLSTAAASSLLKLGVRPGLRAGLGQTANLLHVLRRHRRRRVSPLATDVGQHRGNLLVVQRAAERRHQPDRPFLAAQQDADR